MRERILGTRAGLGILAGGLAIISYYMGVFLSLYQFNFIKMLLVGVL